MLLLLAGIVGGVLLVAYWNEIVSWLKNLVEKLRSAFRSMSKKIAHAAAGFVQRVENGLAAIRHKLYYKEEGQWIEETTTRKIDESEVPATIRAKIRWQEEEVTDELEDELDLTLN